jgi:hypothetical protein
MSPISCPNQKLTEHNSTTGKKVPPAHAKQVYQKEKEISVLVFVQIDLIQIEY